MRYFLSTTSALKADPSPMTISHFNTDSRNRVPSTSTGPALTMSPVRKPRYPGQRVQLFHVPIRRTLRRTSDFPATLGQSPYISGIVVTDMNLSASTEHGGEAHRSRVR